MAEWFGLRIEIKKFLTGEAQKVLHRKMGGRCNSLLTLVLTGGILASITAAPAAAQYHLSTFDAPGAVTTFADGINNQGQIVGNYTDANFDTRGFLFDGHTFTSIMVPGAFSTELNDINDQGVMVGSYVAADFSAHSFMSSGGGPIDVDYPGAAATTLNGINNHGDISGYYSEFGGSQTHGFLLNGSGFTSFDAPGLLSNVFTGGINDAGIIVGSYFDTRFHGFVFDGSTFTTLDAPGADETFLSDINNQGDIVGFIETGGGSPRTGFVLHNGQWTTVAGPEAGFTNLMSINDAGTVLGYYADANDQIHGFTATAVPEPSTGLWLGAMVLCGGALLHRTWLRRQSSLETNGLCYLRKN